MPPTSGRWLKLQRAREHLAGLDVSLEVVFDAAKSERPNLVAGFDPEDGSWVVRVGEYQPVGATHASAAIGDAVHNLRGALDHLVWDLAILDHGEWPLNRHGRELETQFPICRRKKDFDSAKVQSIQLDSISAAHRAQIEGSQPYVTGERTLVRLADMSNTDKHRTIHPVFIVDHASQPYVRGTRDCEVVGGAGRLPIRQSGFRPQTEVLRLPLSNIGPDPHVDVLFEMAMGVGLRDGSSVTGTLTGIAEVVEEILAVFEDDLSRPEALETRRRADQAHPALFEVDQ